MNLVRNLLFQYDIPHPNSTAFIFQVVHSKRPIGLLTDSDRDESINKYKRRPPWESFKRMLR